MARRVERAAAGHLPPRPRALYVALVSYCLTSVAAFLWTISVSLKSNQDFFATSPWSLPKHPTLENYPLGVDDREDRQLLPEQRSDDVDDRARSPSLSAPQLRTRSVACSSAGSNFVSMFFLSGLMIPGFLIIVPLYFLLRDLHLLGSLYGLGIVYVATQIPFNIYVLTGFFKTLAERARGSGVRRRRIGVQDLRRA